MPQLAFAERLELVALKVVKGDRGNLAEEFPGDLIQELWVGEKSRARGDGKSGGERFQDVSRRQWMVVDGR